LVSARSSTTYTSLILVWPSASGTQRRESTFPTATART
jgi:hypothetical protein